jgi:hypothetical protein
MQPVTHKPPTIASIPLPESFHGRRRSLEISSMRTSRASNVVDTSCSCDLRIKFTCWGMADFTAPHQLPRSHHRHGVEPVSFASLAHHLMVVDDYDRLQSYGIWVVSSGSITTYSIGLHSRRICGWFLTTVAQRYLFVFSGTSSLRSAWKHCHIVKLHCSNNIQSHNRDI